MKSRIFLFACIVGGFAPLVFASGLRNFPYGFNTVDQTYGDYNEGKYHDGIDLPGAAVGQEVKSPISGTVINYFISKPGKWGVCVREKDTQILWAFGHIEPRDMLFRGDPVVAGDTVLGKLQKFPPESSFSYPHLHVSIAQSVKYCADGNAEDPLPYFSPVVQALTPADIFFAIDKATAANEMELENKFPSTGGDKTIFGDVDVIAHARNNINGGNRSGVHKIDYAIVDYLSRILISSGTPFAMYGPMNAASDTLKQTYLSPPTSDPEDGTETDWQNYYNITNLGSLSGTAVQLDSNIKENSWKTDDYPDSRYSVQVRTYAYPAAGAPAPSEAERLVVTDNTRPYVKQVEVKKGGLTVYKSSWAVEGALLRSYKPIVEAPLFAGE